MADSQDLEQKIRLYGVAVDSRRWDLFDGIFSNEIVAEYGAAQFEGLEAFKHGAQRAWGDFDRSQHAVTAAAIKVRGNEAYTLSYGSWHIVRKGTAGGELWRGVGWYDDKFSLIDGQWLIVRRKCRVIWGEGNPRVMQVSGQYTDEISTVSLHEEHRNHRVMFFEA